MNGIGSDVLFVTILHLQERNKMRYIIKEKQYPNFLDRRIKTRFLFFPKKLWNNDGLKEVRWLEKTTWFQYWNDNGKLGKWKNEKWRSKE